MYTYPYKLSTLDFGDIFWGETDADFFGKMRTRDTDTLTRRCASARRHGHVIGGQTPRKPPPLDGEFQMNV